MKGDFIPNGDSIPNPGQTTPSVLPDNAVGAGKARLVAQCGCGREIPVSIEVGAPLIERYRTPSGPLSASQLKALELAAAGMTDREIARATGTSLEQVKHAMRDTLMRLGARNRANAVFQGITEGLLTNPRLSS